MTQDERKHKAKFPKVSHHFRKASAVADEPASNWSYQPVIFRPDDSAQAKLIRSQVKPFIPATDITENFPESNPAANMRKVIDFAVASLQESDKQWHCQVMFEMCERLANCWNCTNHITKQELYFMYQYFNWTCPKTGTKHSIRTPLSIEFKTHVWQGGVMRIANTRPIYNGNLPGEFHWIGKPDYLQVIAA